MKKYDRESKKWVNEEEIQRKLKKRKLCKGGQEHDFVLMLPYLVEHSESRLGIEVAEEYYRITDDLQGRIKKLQEEENLQLERLGIKTRWKSWSGANTRQYICLRCQKQHYGEL